MEFGIRDIVSMHVDISFDGVKLETLHSKLASIERGRFISGTITTDTIMQFVDARIPALRLAGRGFEILVYRDSIRLTASTRVESIPRVRTGMTGILQEELFAKDSLQKMSVDFNAVAGHVMGRLGVSHDATRFAIRLNLRMDGAHYHANMFGDEAAPALQSLVGESIEIQHINPEFRTREVFLGRESDAYYDLRMQEPWRGDGNNAVAFSGQISFDDAGVQDLGMVLDEYLKRINSIVKMLAGGLEANE